MKKVSKLGSLQRKADKLIQIENRRCHKKCEACGGKNEVGHHWIEKSRSANLRYDFRNIIPLCNSCHAKIHNVFGNSVVGGLDVAEIIIKKRGKRWKNQMDKDGRKEIKVNREHYEEVIKKLSPPAP
jgi:hypothetical protein